MTVRTWAMDNLTTLIFESLLGAPPVTLATLKRASSAFNSFNYMIATTHPKLCSYFFENNIFPDDRKNFQCNAILADLPCSDHGLRNKLPQSQKKKPHVGSHHNPKEHTDLAIRSAQTQKINNISTTLPGKIHNRPNKTRMSAAMSSTHKASDHQQGLHKTKKPTRSLGKPRT